MSVLLDASGVLAILLGGLVTASEVQRLRRGHRVASRLSDHIAARHPATRFGRSTAATVLGSGILWLGGRKRQDRLRQLLRASGVFAPQAAAVFGWGCAALTATASLALLPLASLLRHGIVMLPIAALLIGSAAPAFLLRLRAARHGQRLRAEMPIVICLLLLTAESGSSIDQAIRFTAGATARAKMTSRRLLGLVVEEIAQGAPYEQALARFSERATLPEAQDLAGLLVQSITFGTEIGDSLKALVGDLLERRLAASRAAIGRRAVLLSVILIICFLPVLFILIGAPALSALLHALSATK